MGEGERETGRGTNGVKSQLMTDVCIDFSALFGRGWGKRERGRRGAVFVDLWLVHVQVCVALILHDRYCHFIFLASPITSPTDHAVSLPRGTHLSHKPCCISTQRHSLNAFSQVKFTTPFRSSTIKPA